MCKSGVPLSDSQIILCFKAAESQALYKRAPLSQVYASLHLWLVLTLSPQFPFCWPSSFLWSYRHKGLLLRLWGARELGLRKGLKCSEASSNPLLLSSLTLWLLKQYLRHWETTQHLCSDTCEAVKFKFKVTTQFVMSPSWPAEGLLPAVPAHGQKTAILSCLSLWMATDRQTHNSPTKRDVLN